MALPFANTTCDIYRASTSRVSPPDLAGIPCLLEPEAGASTLTTNNYTHVLLVGPDVDLRDGSPDLTEGTAPDTVSIPDRYGTDYTVILVRRKGRGSPVDHKVALLKRAPAPPNAWPSNDV